MILTKADMENIATSVIADFRIVTGIFTIFTPIDQLAKDFLGLEVNFEKLSDDNNFCGFTAYEDTSLSLEVGGVKKVVKIRKKQIILDYSFIEVGRVERLCSKRRFTLAHEVAHQILFSLETDEDKKKYQHPHSMRIAHKSSSLKTFADWNEWQANFLGAALLMPKDCMELIVEKVLCQNKSLKQKRDEEIKYLSSICSNIFHVSKSAAQIRLKNLGYIPSATS